MSVLAARLKRSFFRCARMPDTPAILSNLSFQRPRVAPYQEFAALLHQRDEAGGICRSLQKNEENRQNPSNSSFFEASVIQAGAFSLSFAVMSVPRSAIYCPLYCERGVSIRRIARPIRKKICLDKAELNLIHQSNQYTEG